MTIRQNWILGLLIFVLEVSMHETAAGEQAGQNRNSEAAANPRGTWQELFFESERTLGRITARLRLQYLGDSVAGLETIAADRGSSLLGAGADTHLLSVRIEARFWGRTKIWTGQSWFEAPAGTGLQRTRLKTGKEGSYKLYRYATEGVYRKRAEPADDREAKLAPDLWSHHRLSFYPFPTGKGACSEIVDPLALLFILATNDLRPPFEKTLCVFNKRSLYRVVLRATDTNRETVRFREHSAGKSLDREKPLDAAVVGISATPLAPENGDREPFEFLGFEGEVTLLVDRPSGIPFRIRGAIPGVGRTELILTQVTVSPGSGP